jgi:hypothetical protein
VRPNRKEEKQDCIEMLKMFDNRSEEWGDAMKDFKQAQTQLQRFMDQLSHILAVNDDGDPDRKRSADEEVTEDFVESLRNSKHQATPPLHQPSQEMTQGPFYQH